MSTPTLGELSNSIDFMKESIKGVSDSLKISDERSEKNHNQIMTFMSEFTSTLTNHESRLKEAEKDLDSMERSKVGKQFIAGIIAMALFIGMVYGATQF